MNAVSASAAAPLNANLEANADLTQRYHDNLAVRDVNAGMDPA